MTVIVKDTGFAEEDLDMAIVPLKEATSRSEAVDLPSDTDPASLAPLLPALGLIRVDFPSFADGRGFTIARQLRLMGYRGRLRARGHVIADQYAMARRAGFDEVEINDDLARRQPEDHWLFRANWHVHDYQSRLRG